MALIEIDDLEKEIGTTVSEDDYAFLESLVTAVWSLWEEYTNRKWEMATYTEYHSIKGTDINKLYLRNYPVFSITSIYDDSDWAWGATSLISSADYTFEPDTGIVYYNGYFDEGDRNVKVIYQAGYGGSGDALPEAVRRVLMRQAARWYKQAKNFQDYEKLDNVMPEFEALADRHRRRSV